MFSGRANDLRRRLEYNAPPSVDQDVAMRVRRNRRQRRPAEIRACRLTSPSRNLSVYGSATAVEELSRPQRHFRPGRRVRIREDVERVVAIPPVGLDVLIDDARRNVNGCWAPTAPRS